jgi:hypothetical protein
MPDRATSLARFYNEPNSKGGAWNRQAGNRSKTFSRAQKQKPRERLCERDSRDGENGAPSSGAGRLVSSER